MKNFLVVFLLYLIVGSALGMDHKRERMEMEGEHKLRKVALTRRGSDRSHAFKWRKLLELAGVAQEEVNQAKQRRACLSSEEHAVLLARVRYELGRGISERFVPGETDEFVSSVYMNVKKLLNDGLDPNCYASNSAFGVETLLTKTIRVTGAVKLIALIIAYGADPNKANLLKAQCDRRRDVFPLSMDDLRVASYPIESERDLHNLEVFQLLVRNGARIDPNPKESIFYISWDNLRALVWGLQHGVSANRLIRDYIFNKYIGLSEIIALFHFGARLTIDELRRAEEVRGRYPYEAARREFLQAITSNKLATGGKFDIHRDYSSADYVAMGISPASALLIQRAVKEVNDEVVRCVEDDFAYRYGNWTQFVLDREVGRISRRKR